MATAEEGQAKLRELLGTMPVRQVMTPDPITVAAATTVREFLSGPPWRYRHSAFPVIGPDGRPVGAVSINQAGQNSLAERGSTTVAAMMAPIEDIPTAAPDDPLVHLLPAIEARPVRRALVLAEGRLVGIVTHSDVSRVSTWLASASTAGSGRAQDAC
ncbi:CBS domain-containing protein [Streptomyces swartbergensis]|nr:CBS domain-containing protein [Streptomyces swartbergensis]